MTIYPFVHAANDLGTAKGPRLAITWHMAEGGGTVSYLAKPNPNGVSVHFVVEYTGRVVQMLKLDHMQSSLRTSDIRTSDDPPYGDPPITYGRTAALAVMGKWADISHGTLGPNHASIGVEVEGFAAVGLNDKQSAAIGALFADMSGKYPGIRSLGHRDFQDYKACPGKHFPWGEVDGHGPSSEDDMGVSFTILPGPSGSLVVNGSGHAYQRILDGTLHQVPDGYPKAWAQPVKLLKPMNTGPGDRQTGYLVGDEAAVFLAQDVTFTPVPTPDCSAVQRELDLANSRIAQARTALGGAN